MRVATAVILLAFLMDAGAFGQTFPAGKQGQRVQAQTGVAARPESAQRLMKDVIYNELHDRERDSFWEYRSHLVTRRKNVLREQIETPEGPVYRVLARGGKPLAGAQMTEESARLEGLLHSPEKLAKVEQAHEADEARLGKVMVLLPKAYVYHFVGARTGDRVVLEFAPNPKFVSSGYMDRILSGLTGQIVVNQRLKRMISMDGRIAQRINFGFGLLGYVEPGGTFRIHRTQVSAAHWKTDLVAVDVHGRILLFSDVSKQEKETRWGFTPVPHDITLAQAGSDLREAASAYVAKAESSGSGDAGGDALAENARER
ncbi:MAG: hypothetical protein ACP5M4_09265 [Acidobacteriaceae bacterium]